MDWLFTQLTHGIEGGPAIALAAAFTWGVVSIVLSPCHLASIPLIVGYIGGQGEVSTRRAAGIAAVFAGGILFTIALVGVITALAGRILGDVGGVANYLVAAVFLLVGLHLVGVIPFELTAPRCGGVTRRGWLGALILGLVFGIALGPCTFAFMAPLLGVTFRLAASQILYGTALLIAYGVGHCMVIVIAGAGAELVQRYLTWADRTRTAAVLRQACGVLVLLGGLYLFYTAR